MIRRILAVTLIVLGLVAAAAGIASATMWRPADTATIAMPARPDEPVVVIPPGVLEAIDSDVEIRAVADEGQPVLVAFGVPEDVVAWVAPVDHLRVTGFASWEEFEITEVSGEPLADTDLGENGEATDGEGDADQGAALLPDPATSDLWIHQETGTGSVEFTWEERPGRWSMLVATDGTEPAPEIEFTWDVEVSTPYLLPGLALGVLLFCLGVAWLIGIIARDRRRRRRAERRQARMEARTDETAVFAAIRDDDPPFAPVTSTGTATAASAGESSRAEATGAGEELASSADEPPQSRRGRRRRSVLPAEGSAAAKDELADYASETPPAAEAQAASPAVAAHSTAPAAAAGPPRWLSPTEQPEVPDAAEAEETAAEPAPTTRREARSRSADASGWRSAWGLGPVSSAPAAATPRWQATGARHDDDDQPSDGEENS